MTRERMIKERRREEAETLRGGGMRWMLKMREGIQQNKQTPERERETREGRRNGKKVERKKCSGEKEKMGEGKRE